MEKKGLTSKEINQLLKLLKEANQIQKDEIKRMI